MSFYDSFMDSSGIRTESASSNSCLAAATSMYVSLDSVLMLGYNYVAIVFPSLFYHRSMSGQSFRIR